MGSIDKDAVYLGMPMFPSKSRFKTYHYTLERVTARVEGWKTKLLSFAGRATLIKSVISGLRPSYTMSSTQLPISLC